MTQYICPKCKVDMEPVYDGSSNDGDIIYYWCLPCHIWYELSTKNLHIKDRGPKEVFCQGSFDFCCEKYHKLKAFA